MSSGSTAFPSTDSTANPHNPGERFQEAPPNAHDNIDSKDQRSHKNTVAAASEANKAQKQAEEAEGLAPTEVAKSHGNDPSRGAVIDEQIQNEEAEYLRQKGKA
ncbi:hypothetical protein DL93DRAFT_2080859 [Clavulina sp. PMI_390]|nr:hypothetical protein DL93DRAFT_2080859 [Clavulina sp. PMI_390]